MSKQTKNSIAARLGLGLASICTFALLHSAAGCCGPGGELDDQLQVEIAAPADLESSEAQAERACGMQVRAIDERGQFVELREVQLEDGCVYRAQVDPDQVYTLQIQHPDLGTIEREGAYSHTAGCGMDPDPEMSDMWLELTPAPSFEVMETARRLERPRA